MFLICLLLDFFYTNVEIDTILNCAVAEKSEQNILLLVSHENMQTEENITIYIPLLCFLYIKFISGTLIYNKCALQISLSFLSLRSYD